MTQVFPQNIHALSETVVRLATEKGLKITTAESCTGGLVAGALTSVAGASGVFEYGHVTYANIAKQNILGVAETTLRTTGAVSPDTAREMAQGALTCGGADIALSITGIAGPDGGSAEKPVGLVYFGIATKTGTHTARHVFTGNRDAVRLAAVETGLLLLQEALGRHAP